MTVLKNIWQFAIAELRSCLQMFRTWILITVASSVCIAYWMILTHAYVRDSAGSPIAGVLGPRFAFIKFAQPIVLWFVFGIVFLAFDVRARDVRARMFEVLDVRPVSNLEIITGRLLGTTIPLFVPAVLIVGWIWCYGWLAPVMNWEMGAVVEPVSVLSFLIWDIVPNLLLWGSLTMLLSVILRHRVVIALVVLGSHVFLLIAPRRDAAVSQNRIIYLYRSSFFCLRLSTTVSFVGHPNQSNRRGHTREFLRVARGESVSANDQSQYSTNMDWWRTGCVSCRIINRRWIGIL